MTTSVIGRCLPVLIGSLPVDTHDEAVSIIFEHTPDIPLWAQLPRNPKELMIPQFLPGMPGVVKENETVFVDIGSPAYENEILSFYEDYVSVTEGGLPLDGTRFAMTDDTARGFFSFIDHVKSLPSLPVAVKGQITGPISFTLGIADREKRAIFYDEQARDAAIKLLAMKATWQAKAMGCFGKPVIVFLDEPALASFGTSETISMTADDVLNCLKEVVDAVHAAGALAGIHVCANTDWSLVLDAGVDIVNFDAYGYFDRFILFPERIRSFIRNGGVIAWGIVPTSDGETIDRESVDSLVAKWRDQIGAVSGLGIETEQIVDQSLITPSCGTGSLSPEHARRVLQLTRDVSQTIRRDAGLV